MNTTSRLSSFAPSATESGFALQAAKAANASSRDSESRLLVGASTYVLKKISLLVAGTALLFGGIALPASALSFTFEQTGFTGGGTIKGSFTATDLNNDGAIYADPWGDALNGYEVTKFSLSFTGDTYVPDFTSTSLGVLGYDLAGGKFLGDSPSEGIANNWFGIDGFIYASGQGPANSNGGIVIDLATGAQSVTDQLVTVSAVEAVPESASYGTLGLASLAVLAMAWRRKRSQQDHPKFLEYITAN